MWKVVLCLFAATWSLGEAQKARNLLQNTVNQMTSEVMQELREILDVNVKHILPGSDLEYKTKFSFNMRGMGPLYNSTEPFIDVVARWQAYPEGVVTVSDGHLYISPLQKEWRKWLSHYLGPAGILCVAILFAVILPLAGLFWCCCYWCRLGSRRRPFDREYDSWIRGMLAILFIGLLTLFLLGVVCVFSAEAQVNNNLGEVTSTYRSAVGDVKQFLNVTQEQAVFLLEQSFFNIKDRLMELLNEVVPSTLRVLNDGSNLRSLSTLNRVVQQLDDVRDDLREVQSLTNSLRVRAVDLNSGLRKVKNQLLRTLSKCDQPKCIALHNKYKIGQLDTEIQYSQMPDVSGLLQNVSKLVSSGLKEEMAQSNQVFRTVQRTIQSSVDEQMPAFRSAIESVGGKLKELSNQIRDAVSGLMMRLNQHEVDVDELQDKINEYSVYRQYLGVAAALCVLLMTALLTWGVLVGVCGGRPEVYGAHDCCSKAGGARSLLCGVAVVFTLGGFVALVFALYFAAGVLAQRFVCDPLTYPLGNRLFKDLDQMVDLERTLYGEKKSNYPSLTSAMVQCHRNFTIYEVLQLRRVLDLESMPAVVLAPGELAQQLAAIGGLSGLTGGSLLRAETRTKLQQLADSGLADFDFDRILDALETNMTSLALDGLARQLNSTAHSLARPQFAAEARDLLRAAADLAELDRAVLGPMRRDAAALNETATRLRSSLQLPAGVDMAGAMNLLASQSEAAYTFLADQGDQLMAMVMDQFSTMISEKLTDFIKQATYYVRYDLGRCGPLSRAFNATRDSLCVKVVKPVNGYWMALGWCILLFVPLMVTAKRLAELYMQVDPYPGPLVEAAYKAEKRAGREGREGREGRDVRESREGRARARGGEGRGAGGAGPARADSPLAPPLDAYHARRYNDMAPKHWEEGPPRYHGPTEYERPPPYYYPGPNDRQ